MRGSIIVAFACAACSGGASSPPTAAEVGKLAFADQSLSQPAGQACADCHAETAAFLDPESDFSTSRGVIPSRFGPRNAPTAMYARFIPPLTYDAAAQRFTGGLFWDGRASTLEEQAEKPLLNPLEMNNTDVAAVAAELRAASYADDFRAVFGATALDEPDVAFGHLTDALAAYERTDALAPFSSKYDRYLAGTVTLTAAEQRGLAIFEDPARGNCASCHPSRPSADGAPPLFTDHSYANLGLPKYMNSRFLAQPADMNPDGPAYIDHGLMTTVGDPAQDGKFRVPTLRNIAVTGPYGHNGYFENLPHLLDFLNTRDVGSPTIGTWAVPEVNANLDTHVGKLGLSAQDLDDLFAFLNTLTDE